MRIEWKLSKKRFVKGRKNFPLENAASYRARAWFEKAVCVCVCVWVLECVCVWEWERERNAKNWFFPWYVLRKNVLRSSNDDKTGLDVAFEEMSNKFHIIQMV